MAHRYPGVHVFVILFLFVWSLTVFFPGSYSIDSWRIFYEVTGGPYSDWHSPIIALTWKILYKITAQFFSIYVLQMAIYWLFFYLLLRVVTVPLTYVLTLLIALFLLFIPQYVMKDVPHALSWAMACVLLLKPGQENRRSVGAVAFLLLAYGLLVRPNGIVGMIPLLFILTEMFVLKEGRWKQAGLVSLAALVLLAGYFIGTYKILEAKREYPEYKLRLLDIAGITCKTGVNYFPGCITSHPDYRHDTVMALYSPASIDHIYWPEGGGSFVPRVDAGLNACISEAWAGAIMAHPLVYIANRFEGFLYYLRIKKRFDDDQYWNTALWIDPNNPLGLKREHNPHADYLLQKWNSFNGSVFFDPWFWLLLNMVFFMICLWNYRRTGSYGYKIMACVQLSGVLFMLSQFPVFQHDRDFRYNYWNVFVFVLGFVFLFKDWRWSKLPGVLRRANKTGGRERD